MPVAPEVRAWIPLRRGLTVGDHVISDVDGQWWESGGSSGSGGGADVHRISSVSSAYLSTFNVVLHPRGM